MRLGVDDYLAAGGAVRSLEASALPFAEWQKQAGAAADHVGLIKSLADAIKVESQFAQDAGGHLYHYEAGVYRSTGAAYVRVRVKDLLEERSKSDQWSSHRAEEVVEYIRLDAPLLWERPPLEVINLRNGLLDVASRHLRAHTPAYLSTVQLPVAYDPSATCPGWDQFVSEVFPADVPQLAFEVVAHLMRPDTSIQKAVLLLGEGGNGKSTYLAAVRAFLGEANVAALNLHKLESDRFAAARLLGKLANIAADLPSEHLAGTSVFKMITGGDPLTGERKYESSFDFVPFTRLLFSANHPPRSSDSSQGFFDRWLVVPFARGFRGTEEEIPRPVLDVRLAAPAELSGVLNRALDAPEAIQQRGGLAESVSLRAAYAEFRDTTDPVAVWLELATVEGPDMLATKAQLLAVYNVEAVRSGRPTLTPTAFGRTMRRLRPHLTDGQRTVGGKLQWVWIGLGLRAEGLAEAEEPSQGSRGSRGSITVSSARNGNEDLEVDKWSEGTTIVEPREPREVRESPAAQPDVSSLTPIAAAPSPTPSPRAPRDRCSVCGSLVWWERLPEHGGGWVCGICHPDPRQVAFHTNGHGPAR